MSATPVTLTPVSAPVQARTQLTADQVVAFQNLLQSSGLINFPEGFTASSVSQFFIGVTSEGNGNLVVTLVNPVVGGATGSSTPTA